MNERERFFEQLPFFVNGTLGADADWMREQLAAHPELQAELQTARALRSGVHARAQELLRHMPPDVGYAGVRALIAREAPSLVQRLRGWFAAPSPQGWRLAQGLALGVTVGVGALLAVDRQGAEHTQVRSTLPGFADGPLLRVNFDPHASENEIRLALIEARVLIVAGPTRLGDYYLKPAPSQLQTARESLQRSRVVQRAEEVPELPPEVLE